MCVSPPPCSERMQAYRISGTARGSIMMVFPGYSLPECEAAPETSGFPLPVSSRISLTSASR